MASKCTITFENNPLGVYYAGQTISGIAEIITSKLKKIRSIYIRIYGFAEVRWNENNTRGKGDNANKTYSASELYFSSDKCVYGQFGGNEFELPAGKHAYPFQATIPPTAPTSFNGSDGQIQYEVSVVIDRVIRYDNKFKQGFTVISPYDINLNASHVESIEKQKEKVSYMFSCKKDPLKIKVGVQFSGYAPGQKVIFKVHLDNQCQVSCSNIKVKLLRKVTYKSWSPEPKLRQNEVKIAKKQMEDINDFFEIPSTTPSSLENCSIIKVGYTLKFTAKLNGFYTDLEVLFPITIGTVPLQASLKADPASELPSPKFVEGITANEKFQDNPFIPKYPVFLSNTTCSLRTSLSSREDDMITKLDVLSAYLAEIACLR